MKKKAFIFDLDGVIVDTAKYHYIAWKELANSLGFDFTEEQNELLKGVSRARSLEILLNIGKVSLSQERKDELMKEKNEKYLEYITQLTQEDILPGIKDVLTYLKKENYPIALGSASKNAVAILEGLDLIAMFDTIVDGNHVSKAKPDPEVFLLAAKQVNSLPENCVVIEDSEAGIQAANRAGMISVGIGQDNLNEAKFLLNDTAEFTTDFISQNLL